MSILSNTLSSTRQCFKYIKRIYVHLIYLALISLISWSFLITVTPVQEYELLLKARVPAPVIATLYAKDAKILLSLSGQYMGRGDTYDLVQSQQYLTAALKIDPQVPFGNYQQARIHFIQARFPEAIKAVNQEILYYPDFSRSYYLRGLIFGYDKKLSESASDFQEFIQREPLEWAGYVDLSWVLFQMGDYGGIKATIEQILPNTRNAWLLNAYGVALLNLGEGEAALKALNEAKERVTKMTPEQWGNAYIGNNPQIYEIGLAGMQLNIDENIERVNNFLSKS